MVRSAIILKVTLTTKEIMLSQRERVGTNAMFKTNDVNENKDIAEQQIDDQRSSTPRKRHVAAYLLDALIIVAMGVLLFWGTSTQFSNRFNDVTRYQCYATVFWQGKARAYGVADGSVCVSGDGCDELPWCNSCTSITCLSV